MKNTFKSARTLAAAIITIGSLTWQANAALTLDIIESSDTTFSFTISGNFSGLTVPQPNSTGELVIVPFDQAGNAVTTWTTNTYYSDIFTPPSQSPLPRPQGTVDGARVFAWGLSNQDDNTLAADVFITYNNNPVSSASVIETPISSSFNNYDLNTDGITGFNLYWGNTLADSFTVVPEPSSTLLLGTGALFLLARRRRTS